jgi:hypothetical protein
MTLPAEVTRHHTAWVHWVHCVTVHGIAGGRTL